MVLRQAQVVYDNEGDARSNHLATFHDQLLGLFSASDWLIKCN